MKKTICLGLGTLALSLGALASLSSKPVQTDAAVYNYYSDIYLSGTMNSWAGDLSGAVMQQTYGLRYTFRYSGTDSGYARYTLTVGLENDVTFGIKDKEHGCWVGYWDSSAIESGLFEASGSDIHFIGAAGTYTFVYSYNTNDVNDKQITSFALATSETAAEEINRWSADLLADTSALCVDQNADNSAGLRNIWIDDAIDADIDLFLAGSINNWATSNVNYKLKKAGENLYRISNLDFVKNSGFKILKDSNYDTSWPEEDYLVPKGGCCVVEFNYSTEEITCTVKKYLADSYAELSSSAKALFVKESDDAVVARAYKLYTHVVQRYGLTNFASVDVSPSATVNGFLESEATNSGSLIAITIGVGAILSVGGLFLLRKRKAE